MGVRLVVRTSQVIDLAVSALDAVDDYDFPAERVFDLFSEDLDAPGLMIQETDWRTGAATMVARGYPPGSVELIAQAVPSRGSESPQLMAHIRGDLTPTTAQEVMGGWLAWHRSMHRAWLQEITGWPNVVAVGIRGGPRMLALCLARAGVDFKQPELDMLTETQPLLSAVDRHLCRMRAWRASLPESDADTADLPRQAGLTGRETEALLLLSRGLTANAAARQMSCSVSTVNKHLGNVYRKLGVSDRLDAVLVGQRLGLVKVGTPPASPPAQASPH